MMRRSPYGKEGVSSAPNTVNSRSGNDENRVIAYGGTDNSVVHTKRTSLGITRPGVNTLRDPADGIVIILCGNTSEIGNTNEVMASWH